MRCICPADALRCDLAVILRPAVNRLAPVMSQLRSQNRSVISDRLDACFIRKPFAAVVTNIVCFVSVLCAGRCFLRHKRHLMPDRRNKEEVNRRRFHCTFRIREHFSAAFAVVVFHIARQQTGRLRCRNQTPTVNMLLPLRLQHNIFGNNNPVTGAAEIPAVKF